MKIQNLKIINDTLKLIIYEKSSGKFIFPFEDKSIKKIEIEGFEDLPTSINKIDMSYIGGFTFRKWGDYVYNSKN